jgi:hypothetical protein
LLLVLMWGLKFLSITLVRHSTKSNNSPLRIPALTKSVLVLVAQIILSRVIIKKIWILHLCPLVWSTWLTCCSNPSVLMLEDSPTPPSRTEDLDFILILALISWSLSHNSWHLYWIFLFNLKSRNVCRLWYNNFYISYKHL